MKVENQNQFIHSFMDFINSQDYKKIFTFHASLSNRIIARESGWLEFKESFNWMSKDKYAKSMAAFANHKGGYIIFGVKNQPRELVGLQSNNYNGLVNRDNPLRYNLVV